MQLKICNSGSSGNGYALIDRNETLLIEAGCRFIDIKKTLNFNISSIKGMCISHSHNDHYGYFDEYDRTGIKIYRPWVDEGIIAECFGEFKVQAFSLVHDVPCYGFYITSGNERIVFATDTEYVPPKFTKVKPTTLMIECNYQDKYVSDVNVKRDRVYQTHMELATTKEFVRVNATDSLRNVVLLHLSENSAAAEEIVSEIKQVVDVDVNVVAARKGLTVDLSDWRGK